MQQRRRGRVLATVIRLAVWAAVIVLSPVILLAGEPVNRYVMRRLRRSARVAGAAVVRSGDPSARVVTAVGLTRSSSLLLTAISNPLWIALTAPGRWVADRFSAR